MPPHCDSLDGPVVQAARRALDAGDVTLVLPYAPKTVEKEIIEAFDKVVQARRTNAICREVADRYFFETVVRLHRAGEGAPFTGLKPAGLDVGPIIPIAEKAIEMAERFDHLGHLRAGASRGVDGARSYVQGMLGLQVWAHGLYQATRATGHAPSHTHD
jgi:uncharacterized protein DUF6448